MPGSSLPHSLSSWTSDSDNVNIQYKHLNEDGPRQRPLVATLRTDGAYKDHCLSGKKGITVKVLLFAALFFLGLLIGYLIRRHTFLSCQVDRSHSRVEAIQDYNSTVVTIAHSLITADRIGASLKEVAAIGGEQSGQAHFAGTQNSGRVASIVESVLRKYFDEVMKETYLVRLSNPGGLDDIRRVNSVTLIDPAVPGTPVVKFTASSLGGDDSNHPSHRPYVVNSANGTAVGDPVYVNYGRIEDFQFLARSSRPLNCSGKILIVRLGRLEVSHKMANVRMACGRARQPVGVLLYPDPADVNGGRSYKPGSWWLNATVAPSVVLRHSSAHLWGDPSTPFRAATEYAHHDTNTYLLGTDVPNFPVQTISYGDTNYIMQNMNDGGQALPEGWSGALTDVRYKTGPGYTRTSGRRKWKIKMEVYNTVVDLKPIKNVIGVIRGSVESDKFVLVGSHHDSLTVGAVSPGTGLAILLELAKTFGILKERYGWRPRRTLVFASWDASEYGAYGSLEWIEDHWLELNGELVTYINLDDAVTGNFTFAAEANLLLAEMLYDVTRSVTCHQREHDETSVYDVWRQSHPSGNLSSHLFQTINAVNSRDSEAFSKRVLIPTMDVHYTYDKRVYPGLSHYPVYHTSLDTFDYVSTFIDPDFLAHKTLADVVASSILRLSDSAILPLSCDSYVHALSEAYGLLERDHGEFYRIAVYRPPINIVPLKESIENLTRTATKFKRDILGKPLTSDMMARRINTRMLEAFRYLLVTQRTDSVLSYSPQTGARFSILDQLTRNLKTSTRGNVSILQRHIANLIQWIRVANGILGGSILA